MELTGLEIFRLVIAAINGALFSFGLALLIELSWLRPRRWRRELAWLLRTADREETERPAGDLDAGVEVVSGKRERIDELRSLLRNHFKEPRTRLNIGFSVLVMIVSLLSLLSLLFPAWSFFR